VAVLLEGEFKTSWPRHRLAPELTSQEAFGYREQSVPNKMIVIADGDIIRNRFRVDTTRGVVFPYPLGLDYYSMTLYENKEFLLNAINYLLDDEGLIESRSKEVKVRKLDMQKAEESRSFYQIINIVIPLLLLAIAGVAIVILRRKKFAKKL
jgi:ABC-2 type transport system permease protein